MKLVSFRVQTSLGDHVRIGALVDDDALVIDLNLAYTCLLYGQGRSGRPYEVAAAVIPPDMVQFLTGGEISREAAESAVDFMRPKIASEEPLSGPRGEVIVRRLDEVELLAPVPQPNSIRDTLSFEDHMKNFEKRTGRPIPELWYKMPVYYKGNPRSVVGHDALICWPSFTKKFDYELEFGIYIGREGRDISEADAHHYIGGYTIFNDFSARDVIQEEVSVFLGPAKAKDMDTGNAMGPCLVTPDEIDPADLNMLARINGEVWSQGNSAQMYWSFSKIIEHISKSETLYPGDFIGSGTVANGCGDELDRWIQPGDTVELEVEGIGILRNTIAKAEQREAPT